MSVTDFADPDRLAAAKQQLREAAERGEARLRRSRRGDGDQRVACGSMLSGHEMELGEAVTRCRHCRAPWDDALVTLACLRSEAA